MHSAHVPCPALLLVLQSVLHRRRHCALQLSRLRWPLQRELRAIWMVLAADVVAECMHVGWTLRMPPAHHHLRVVPVAALLLHCSSNSSVGRGRPLGLTALVALDLAV
jgi:hypothetical protein